MKADTTIYQGCRGTCGPMVICNGAPLFPTASQKVRNHSPDGFEWGYSGSGPAQLALALLLDFLEDADEARHRYMEFKFNLVSGWRDDAWTLTGQEIRLWVEQHRRARPFFSVDHEIVEDEVAEADGRLAAVRAEQSPLERDDPTGLISGGW